MAKRIRVEMEGAGADYTLLEDLAPKTTAAIWDSLPVETSTVHGRISGDCIFIPMKSGPVIDLPEKPELGVTSIYKGYIVLTVLPQSKAAELFVSYGQAEFRDNTGRRYGTLVAELDGDGSALFDMLKRTRAEGRKAVSVRRLDG